MLIQKQLYITLLLLIAVLLIFELTSIDIWVQDYFYDAAATHKPPLERWLVYKHNKTLEFWFHKSTKIVIMAFGIGIFFLALLSFWFKKLTPYRQRLFFLSCAMVLVPLLIGGAKHITNSYCPNQTVIYGGNKPYVKLLERYPADFYAEKKGRCFPAGHASVGFGLMALYFVFYSHKAGIMGGIFGLTLGWALGIFQIIRGEHFLSHTIFSMVASWLVILLIFAFFTHTGRFYPLSRE